MSSRPQLPKPQFEHKGYAMGLDKYHFSQKLHLFVHDDAIDQFGASWVICSYVTVSEQPWMNASYLPTIYALLKRCFVVGIFFSVFNFGPGSRHIIWQFRFDVWQPSSVNLFYNKHEQRIHQWKDLHNVTYSQHQSSGSRLQPLRGDPDNPPPEGTNAIAQARTPQARPSGPAREKNFQCRFFA